MNNEPLVSIIVPAYNAEKYIKDAINSLIVQTYKNLEIIVVNDGSTDGTGKILKSFDSFGIKIFNQPNKGQDAALNFGYKQSTGDFIKFFDADDILSENCIELQVNAIKNEPEYVAYGEWGRFFNDDTKTVKFINHAYYKNLNAIDFLCSDKAGPMLQCGIMLISRDLIESAGLWDERLILYNDTEFFTRLLLKSNGVIFTKGAKLYYRSGMTTNLSSQKARKYFESTFLASKLIKEHLFKYEKSERTYKLVANLFWVRRYEMYPHYPELAKEYIKEIKSVGGSKMTINSGIVYNFVNQILGWKIAKLLQIFYYMLRY